MRFQLRVRPGPVLASIVLSLAILALGGCLSAAQSRLVRVQPAPAPAKQGAGGPEAVVPAVVAEAEGFTAGQRAKFLAAREAFWSYDTETAVSLLRELRREGVLDAESFHALVLQCYELSDRWAETLPLFAEFELEQVHPAWWEFARFRAGLPRREIEFARDAPAIPISLKHDDLVIAEVEINGIRARVLVDTGASMSWLAESFARRAGAEILPQTIRLNDANDRGRDTPLGLVRELRVGGVTVRHTPALIGRSMILQLNTPVDGILGWDILQHIDLTFDFPGKRLTLAEPRGPVRAEPGLAGRVGPILELVSATGRPLHVFFDTGAHFGRACIDFFEGAAAAAEAGLAEFRRGWRPTVSMAMHSVTFAWPRFAEPFAFWMAGHRFDLPRASLHPRGMQQERLIRLDGTMGNAPFLGGKLRLCGVKRIVEFELGR